MLGRKARGFQALSGYAVPLARQAEMTKEFDYAQIYYWRIEIFEPEDPDDDRYIFLYGEEGEIVGPMTVELAQAWIRRFSRRRPNGEGS